MQRKEEKINAWTTFSRIEIEPGRAKELEALVWRHSPPQQLVRRARMILAAHEGKRNGQIAREQGVSVDMVRKWRMHWIGLQAVTLEDLDVRERLVDILRPGRPAQITAEQICQLIALACQQPKEHPISHWSGRELAEEVMTRGIIAHISPRHATRLLKKGLSNRI